DSGRDSDGRTVGGIWRRRDRKRRRGALMMLVSQAKRVLLTLMMVSPAFAQPEANSDGASRTSEPQVGPASDTEEGGDAKDPAQPKQAPTNPRDATPHGANPHGTAMGAPPTNRSFVDEKLPEGTVV